MSKLKTLKDLTRFGCSIKVIESVLTSPDTKMNRELEMVKIEDLKQEAIKWIKNKFPLKMNVQLDSYYWGGKSELMKFFNLTEEDLMTNEEINNREHGEGGNN